MAKKQAVKKKSKTSKIKQNNRLMNKGIIKPKRRNAKNNDDDSKLEDNYANTQSIHRDQYLTKPLLPVKSKKGIEMRTARMEDSIEEEEQQNVLTTEDAEPIDEDQLWLNRDIGGQDEIDLSEPISMAKLFAKREEKVSIYKQRIGYLACTLLENPEMKIGNLKSLLEIMNDESPEVLIIIKKIVTLSLMEIFRDLIPSYQIKHHDSGGRKLKKETEQLLGYENQLLKGYQQFLMGLEKLSSCLRKKKGDTRVISKPQLSLAKLAVKSLCELLVEHPYFNLAEEIVHLLTIYLDNPDEEVRLMVVNCYKNIFHTDKRGMVSLKIVQKINQLVKTKAHSVHCEVLAVLLALQIKNVNLDKEKEEEIKNKKLQSKKQRVTSLSKKERKRKKELAKLDNELLEAQAEENKKKKEQHLTEIVKTLFLIYFRILKSAPRSNLLSITLEGLAKFAHCINIEYYQNLANTLDQILEHEKLNVRERLYCIKTVFIILSGQGDALNIDPLSFYTHLYKTMLDVTISKTDDSTDTLLSTLEAIVLHKRKKMTTQRMLSFTKRLGTIGLQISEEGTLGCLNILKSVLQLTKSADLLLDVDSNFGQGIYNPELDEPEYANAGSTALWELCALRRHYHPFVRQISDHISHGAPTSGAGSLPAHLINFDKETKPSLPRPKDDFGKRGLKLSNKYTMDNNFVNRCTEIMNMVE